MNIPSQLEARIVSKITGLTGKQMSQKKLGMVLGLGMPL